MPSRPHTATLVDFSKQQTSNQQPIANPTNKMLMKISFVLPFSLIAIGDRFVQVVNQEGRVQNPARQKRAA